MPSLLLYHLCFLLFLLLVQQQSLTQIKLLVRVEQLLLVHVPAQLSVLTLPPFVGVPFPVRSGFGLPFPALRTIFAFIHAQ